MGKRYEEVDDTPVAMPLRFRRVENLTDQIRRTIREEFSRQALMEGNETFDEADDFDVGDDYDPTSPYELDFDQESYDARHDTRYDEQINALRGEPKEEEGELREGGKRAKRGKKGNKRDIPEAGSGEDSGSEDGE